MLRCGGGFQPLLARATLRAKRGSTLSGRCQQLDSFPRRNTPPPALARLGHNQGPPLVESQWHLAAWRIACRQAWDNPPIEVIRRRLRRAQALGMTYRQYTLEVLEHGRYL